MTPEQHKARLEALDKVGKAYRDLFRTYDPTDELDRVVCAFWRRQQEHIIGTYDALKDEF